MPRRPSFLPRQKKPGPEGPTGPGGNPGAQGPAGLPNLTSVSSTPGRALNTTFQPHATRPTQVSYAASISCTVSLGGSVTGTVELRSDANNPPTTVRARTSLTHALGLGVGVGSTVANTDNLSFMVPPGHFVRLVTSGTASIALVDQTEVVM